MLRKYHPLYMNVQFNHPWELSKEARQACNDLADAGIPLGNQSVLLRGVNDNPDIFKSLCHEVLKLRVKPYYLYQCDLVRGTEHFRVKTLDGIEMMNSMRGFTTGFATPKFVIDSPGGGGKIEVFDKNTIVTISPEATYVKNRMGEVVRYPEPRENQLFSEETRKDANGKDKTESKDRNNEKPQAEQVQPSKETNETNGKDKK
jgi:lysine 2,3-aminomutase